MGWSIGYDPYWQRDVGYGVPAVCDHPGCNEKINRGLGYVCGGEPYGEPGGCGLYFCGLHRQHRRHGKPVCQRCRYRHGPFQAKPDVREWVEHKLNDPSWAEWREENPTQVKAMTERLQQLESEK